ncbi:MAG: hypothetical protein ACLR6J_13045 [Parabacteroides merdae]
MAAAGPGDGRSSVCLRVAGDWHDVGRLIAVHHHEYTEDSASPAS